MEDVLTTFTLESPGNSVGTWLLSAGFSAAAPCQIRQLSTGSNACAFTTQYFTPTLGGTYEFGQSEAPLDTVMLQGYRRPVAERRAVRAGLDRLDRR